MYEIYLIYWYLYTMYMDRSCRHLLETLTVINTYDNASISMYKYILEYELEYNCDIYLHNIKISIMILVSHIDEMWNVRSLFKTISNQNSCIKETHTSYFIHSKTSIVICFQPMYACLSVGLLMNNMSKQFALIPIMLELRCLMRKTWLHLIWDISDMTTFLTTFIHNTYI